MAQRTIVELIDDLDQKPIREGGGETVTFGLEGTEYEIDLSKANAEKLRKALHPYVSAGRKVGGRRGRPALRAVRGKTKGDADPKEVRAWAESQGIEVSSRGRIPASLVLQFKEAKGS
jgi:hypothetical protein